MVFQFFNTRVPLFFPQLKFFCFIVRQVHLFVWLSSGYDCGVYVIGNLLRNCGKTFLTMQSSVWVSQYCQKRMLMKYLIVDLKKENLVQKSFCKQFDLKLQVDCKLKNVSFLVEGRVDSLHLGQNLTGLEFGKFCH